MAASLSSVAQAGDPRSSSKSAAQYDAASTNSNIADSRDIMYFSRMGVERSSNADTKELAGEILTDFTEILYSMEELSVAGAGNAANKPESLKGTFEDAASLHDKLSSARGFNFDTLWTGSLLRMQQAKLAGLTEQKEYVTDSRLKTAITEAMSPIRRHIAKLNSLYKQLIRQDQQEKREAARQLKLKSKSK
ncbi:MAG: DUF4142 domain-containing protein [Chitinophagaceae bacterium]|nr:DUF4142 domain-containing protein [Chitinophagaceae bacterium]